jgi:hypothetical protein
MPQIPIDHVEIRWRRQDTAAAWTTEVLKPGNSCITITGISRGATYQIEARNVGTNGAASVWTQQTHVVDSANDTPLTPLNLVAIPVEMIHEISGCNTRLICIIWGGYGQDDHGQIYHVD